MSQIMYRGPNDTDWVAVNEDGFTEDGRQVVRMEGMRMVFSEGEILLEDFRIDGSEDNTPEEDT